MESQNAPFFIDNEVIVLKKNGQWVADGVEITHEGTRKLFARSLARESDGYYVSVGREKKKIVIEDTPFFVVRVEGSPNDGFTLFLNNEKEEKLNPTTLEYSPGRLVCSVQDGTEKAKFLHAAYFQILQFLEEDADGYFLRMGAKHVVLSKK